MADGRKSAGPPRQAQRIQAARLALHSRNRRSIVDRTAPIPAPGTARPGRTTRFGLACPCPLLTQSGPATSTCRTTGECVCHIRLRANAVSSRPLSIDNADCRTLRSSNETPGSGPRGTSSGQLSCRGSFVTEGGSGSGPSLSVSKFTISQLKSKEVLLCEVERYPD